MLKFTNHRVKIHNSLKMRNQIKLSLPHDQITYNKLL